MGLRVPVLVLRGREDRLSTVAWVQRLAALARQGRMVELPGAHTFPWAVPNAWSEPVRTRFLLERLQPGGTIYLSDCRLRRPVTRIGDRRVFQFGALGGMEPDEFHAGRASVAADSARSGRYGSAPSGCG